MTTTQTPRASVIIPTYNRQELLRKTLHNLTRQTLPTNQFEVIIADDGSTDDTRTIVEQASQHLNIKYHYQPDKGFRVALARNNGAQLATAPILIFLDTGAYVGPHYLTEHLNTHTTNTHNVTLGYTYGYQFEQDPAPGLAQAAATKTPEQVIAEFRGRRRFSDGRHEAFTQCNFNLKTLKAPWVLLWSLNFSLPTTDYWKVGGFDETFHGWGLEDLELGYRLQQAGQQFQLSTTAWALHAPHDRAPLKDAMAGTMQNMHHMLAKHPEPTTELAWNILNNNNDLLQLDNDIHHLTTNTTNHPTDISRELIQTLPQLPPGPIAIIGAGNHLPTELTGAITIDYDPTTHPDHHAIGIRTPLPDNHVTTVILTSRLTHLWPHWSTEITTEAARIATTTHHTPTLTTNTTHQPG